MLAIIGLGFTVLTLNWFDVATAFPLIRAEFNVGLGSPHRGRPRVLAEGPGGQGSGGGFPGLTPGPVSWRHRPVPGAGRLRAVREPAAGTQACGDG